MTSSGSFGFPLVGVPRGGRVHSGSRWLTGVRLGVVGFIRVRVGSLGLNSQAPDCPHKPIRSPLLASLLTGHPILISRPTFSRALPTDSRSVTRVSTAHAHSSNLHSAMALPQVISNHLEAECRAGHTVDPFLFPPLPNFVVNPWALVREMAPHYAPLPPPREQRQ